MKRLSFLFAVILTAALLCSCGIRLPMSTSTGLCMMTVDGQCLLIVNNSPIVLANRSGDNALFDGLGSGDTIRVRHDGVQESYPARTSVYRLKKLADGSVEDLPAAMLDSLAELGWHPREMRLPSSTPDSSSFEATVSWANYNDTGSLWAAACNRSTAIISSVQHLPILKFESLRELEDFKSAFSSQFEMRHGYDEVPSFETITAAMDESYFAEHTLLLVYLSAGSCSYRYGVNSVDIQNGALTVHVQRTDTLTYGDCAMAGWFITVSVPQNLLDGVTVFDADLGNLRD